MRKLLLITGILIANTAFAVPVQWTFQGVVFDDGATLTGSFIFDVDSDTVFIQPQHPIQASYYAQAFYSDVSIFTSAATDPLSAFYINPPGFAEDYIGPYLQPAYDVNTGDLLPPPAASADPSSYQNGVEIFKEEDVPFFYFFRDHLSLNYAQPLTNAGGIVAISGYQERDVFDSSGLVVSTQRSIVSGTLVANVGTVPIPAAVWLFGSGLGLLGWFRRRKA